METEEKLKAFESIMRYIKTEKGKETARIAIESLPDYFFEVPASSTGNFHPKYALGEGGLLRHTLATIRCAYGLSDLLWFRVFKEERDLVLVSIILHDGWKYGDAVGKYTIVDHAGFAGKKISANENLNKVLTPLEIAKLVAWVASHMGQWNKDFNKKEIAPLPKTLIESFVHLCDYLASRKWLIMDFDVDIEIEEDTEEKKKK